MDIDVLHRDVAALKRFAEVVGLKINALEGGSRSATTTPIEVPLSVKVPQELTDAIAEIGDVLTRVNGALDDLAAAKNDFEALAAEAKDIIAATRAALENPAETDPDKAESAA